MEQELILVLNIHFKFMETKNVFIILFLFGISLSHAQSIFGKWTTIDDHTGKEKSVVEIYENNGMVYGRIVQILDKAKENKLCDKCEGANKGQPVKGMVILQGLEKDGDTWEDGSILDPETGKIYKCHITLDNPNKLKVRGYIGFSLIGRTQYWNRVKLN